MPAYPPPGASLPQVIGAAGGAGLQGFISGAWYKAPTDSYSSSGDPGGGARAVPLFVPVPVTISEFGCAVDTQGANAGDELLVAIYEDTGEFYPGAKLHGDFAIDIGSGASDPSSVDVTDFTLQPGVYWLASVPTVDGTFATTTSSAANFQLAGDNLDDAVQSPAVGYRDLDATNNTLPATWTTTPNAGSGNFAVVAFRIA